MGIINRNIKTVFITVAAVALFFGFFITEAGSDMYGADSPHSSIYNNYCDSCHFMSGATVPDWAVHVPQNSDDTKYNTLCLSCHNDVITSSVKTHSGRQTSDKYRSGSWSIECRTCHWPHHQMQLRTYGTDSYVAQGNSTSVSADANPENQFSTLTLTGAAWTDDQYNGYYLIPNTAQISYNYKITDTASDTLTVSGRIDPARAANGDPFAIFYGKLVKSTLPTPYSGNKTVRLFNKTGTKSFADGDSTYDGICEVCHTLTSHYRNNGAGTDQSHGNLGGKNGTDCVTCHSHATGFGHGGELGCAECHGHDAGTAFDDDMAFPNDGSGGVNQGYGTYQSHSTHTETTGDDLRGPGVYCDTCHDIDSMPKFKNLDDSGGHTLAETDICDNCHSPGGTYDGVNDTTLGAKANWEGGIYSGDALQSGKEKWCVTCHDESASDSRVDNSGVDAPNIAGDEDGSYTYGTGWGYYKTGHGLASGAAYPDKGGLIEPPLINGAVRPVECSSCHDLATAHIDHNARTFDDGDTTSTDASLYRQGYRLKQVTAGQGAGASTQEPLLVPWALNTANSADNYRLCADCHDADPFVINDDPNTNLVTDIDANIHEYHLAFNNARWASDWSGGTVSQINCTSCHNVHGSTRLAMVRDGKLTNREPGLMIWYNNDAIVSYNATNTNPPVPENLPLSASTGTIWRGMTSGNLCSHCHGDNNTTPEYRAPFQNVQLAPVLSFTGESGYLSDGASPDAGAAGSSFVFRVTYTDANNDAPTAIQVWVDVDDSGVYDAGEKYALTGFVPSDGNYVNGRVYTRSLVLAKAGDNILKYRFYASDASADATGLPVSEASLSILNVLPVLSWTGETYYPADGVNPDTGGNGADFTFRINYTDAENECPPAASDMQVWIDENDNDVYESGEKFDMSEVDGGDVTCSDGKLFTYTKALARAGDGVINYTFRSSDGIDSAVADAEPLGDNSLTIYATPNNPPALDWVEGGCFTGSVKPALGLATGNFEFRVTYTDPDNQAPSAIQVWIDTNDNGDYLDGGEKQTMALAGGGDGDYTNGEVYTYTTALNYAGDGGLNFLFAASDGTDSAVGVPATTDSIVTVVSTAGAKGVRSGGGGDPWYSDIQSAIGSNNNTTILVYEGTWGTVNLTNRSNDTVQAVCGADLTTITGAGDLVFFQNSGDNTVDGFTISGGTNGVATNSATGTSQIKNCKIDSTSAGISFGASSGSIIVENSEIFGNTTGVNMTARSGHQFINTTIRNNGTGIFMQNAGATFTGCLIKENTNNGLRCNSANTAVFYSSQFIGNSASLGGAINNGHASFNLTMENSIVARNHATGDDTYGRGGGAFYLTGGTVTITNSTIADNSSDISRGGVGFFQNTNVTIEDSILWNNTAAIEGHISHSNSGGSFTVTDTVISNDGDSLYTNAPYFTGSITPAISGYISEGDPGFIDTTADNYHIQSPSDAIDTGSTDLTIDIDGDSRPQGSNDDIGADESIAGAGVPVLAWTGETDYVSDGVNPVSDVAQSTFVFRVDYSDSDNEPPVLIEVWVDENDNGVFSAEEKYTMSAVDGGDTTYTDGKLYTKSLVLASAGDTVLKYRFYASDGLFEAVGSPTTGGTVAVLNNAPVLSWTGEANYAADGVHPGSGIGGTSFVFRIDYIDADNTAPSVIQVWIDVNDNGSFESGEKFNMTATDGGDATYSDGKRYARTQTVYYAGDGAINYRFSASDGMDAATGAPVTAASITVVNNVPTLSWTGEANYTIDGVDPNSADNGATFTFLVDYTDVDNTSPSSIQIWVDEDDSGDYDSDEKYDMTATDAGDTDYTDGKRYSHPLNLAYAGNGAYNYRFYASDGTAPATGAPISDATVTVNNVVNTAPVLAWSTANCRTEGVRPLNGDSGDTFEFLVIYTDADNHCNPAIQVWVDENDNATYAVGEQFALTEDDTGDTDCTDGKIYKLSRVLSAAGDGLLKYRFYASDGIDTATGDPTSGGNTGSTVSASDQEVGVYAGATVKPSGGDYTTIDAAWDAATSGSTILVYPNSDYTAATYIGLVNHWSNQTGITILSACGADLTIASGNGSSTEVFSFQGNDGVVVDGLTVTGATSRAVYSNSDSLTIRNSRIHGNSRGIWLNNICNPTIIENSNIYDNTVQGFYSNNTATVLTISDTEFTNNGDGSADGAAIYIPGGSGHTFTNVSMTLNDGNQGGAIYCNNCDFTLEDSIINNNTSDYIGGGGIFLNNSSASAIITDTFIQGNSTTASGGAVYYSSGYAVMTNVVMTGNRASGDGGALYHNNGYTDCTFCTISGNYAGNFGGGVYVGQNYTSTFKNSIIFNNDALNGVYKQIYTNYRWGYANVYSSLINQSPGNGSGEARLSFNGVSGNDTASYGSGTVFVSRVEPASAPTSTGDYHIISSSPCVDTASASYTSDHDIYGDTRPVDGPDADADAEYDMGADEYVP